MEEFSYKIRKMEVTVALSVLIYYSDVTKFGKSYIVYTSVWNV